jgi:hypothetical protein
VVLEGDQVQSGALGGLRERDDRLGIAVRRGEERAELQLVSVVGHGSGNPGSAAALPAPDRRAAALRSSGNSIA